MLSPPVFEYPALDPSNSHLILNYMLIDPRTKVDPPIAYVGLATNGLHRRLAGASYAGHLNERFERRGRSKLSAKDRWLAELEQEGLIPGVIVLSEPKLFRRNMPDGSLQIVTPRLGVIIGEYFYAHVLREMGYVMKNDFKRLGALGKMDSVPPHELALVQVARDYAQDLVRCICIPEETKEEHRQIRKASRQKVGFQAVVEQILARRAAEVAIASLQTGKKMGYVELCITEGCDNGRRGKQTRCESCLDKVRKKTPQPTPISEDGNGTAVDQRPPPRLLRAT